MNEPTQTSPTASPPENSPGGPELLPNPPPSPPAPATGGPSLGGDMNANQWAMILHLSQLAGMIVPGVGLAAPIIIWQLKKEQFPELNPHGMMVTNWIISLLIYYVVAIIIARITCVGILLLVPLSIVAVVFAILGGLKARDGVLWKYPLSLTFLK